MSTRAWVFLDVAFGLLVLAGVLTFSPNTAPGWLPWTLMILAALACLLVLEAQEPMAEREVMLRTLVPGDEFKVCGVPNYPLLRLVASRPPEHAGSSEWSDARRRMWVFENVYTLDRLTDPHHRFDIVLDERTKVTRVKHYAEQSE